MSFSTERDIGQYVDLTYLNKKKVEVAPRANKKSGKQTLCEVGTAYIFEVIGNEIKAWRRIDVAMA
jgi:hypothetical protein